MSASMSSLPDRLTFAWDNRGWGEMRIWMPVAYGMADEEVRHG